jgi:protein-S-isoprenylcysteine O-methyltransferase Ste14
MGGLDRWLIPALWIGWMVFWFIAAFGAKKVQRSESVASRASHWVPMVAGALLLTVSGHSGSWLFRRVWPSSEALFLVSALLVSAGIGFACWARSVLAGNWSGTITLKENHELVQAGPYRLVRHPIYTGLLLAVVGSAIARGEWSGVLGLGLITLACLRKIGIEEQLMQANFPAAYASYRETVPRLIPFLF